MDKLIENLFAAYYDARRNKRNTLNQLRFEMDFEHHLFDLAASIRERRLELKPFVAFIVNKPVQREIFASDFRDRVIHHLIIGCIIELIERKLINDSYSCRAGKGTLYGINRVDSFIRRCSCNYQSDAYILKLDIQGYFMSIVKETLYDKVQKILGDETSFNGIDRDTINYLLKNVIFNSPEHNCRIKGCYRDWEGLPPSKSLFNSDEGVGLPIGNYTSQVFGNIYLNDVDHFIKHQMKIKYYGRYVDDMVFVHRDKNYLKELIPVVDQQLTKIGLKLHPNKIYLQHFSKGVSFLGRFIKPYRTYTGTRAKVSFKNAIREVNTMLDDPENIDMTALREIQSKINSYVGQCKQANSHNLLQAFIPAKLTPEYNRYFYLKQHKLILKPIEQIEWQFFRIYPCTKQLTTSI